MDELFGISGYKDNNIRFYIFDDFQHISLIKNGSDHNIKFIEEKNKIIIKVSRIEKEIVKTILYFKQQ